MQRILDIWDVRKNLEDLSVLTISNLWVMFPWMSSRKTFPKWVPKARNWKGTNGKQIKPEVLQKKHIFRGKKIVLMKDVEEDKKKIYVELERHGLQQGLGGLGGKTVKLQGVE